MTMERRELERVLRQLEQTIRANMGGNMVGRVVAVNETTIDVQPVINKKINGKSIRFPVFAQVPPIFLHGGASYETWPIAVGDYCFLVISENCFDSWYAGLDLSDPIEERSFDYSDCVAICGLHNRDGALTIPNIITRQGNSIHTGNHEHVGNTNHTGDTNQTGNKSQIGNHLLTGVLNIDNSSATRSELGGDYEFDGDIYLVDGASETSLKDFISGRTGATGSFESADDKLITVADGLITSIEDIV